MADGDFNVVGYDTAETDVSNFWDTSGQDYSGGGVGYDTYETMKGIGNAPSPDTSIWKTVSTWLQDPAARTVAGGAIAGMAGGIFAMLKGSNESKSAKELMMMKYGLEKQSEADKVARASSMPSVRRMTPAGAPPPGAPGAAVPQGWQAPALSATKRGLINS